MIFPDSYFEDEVREGFYVPGLMKRAWAAQLEVFDCVREICEKHHIRYFAEWGTLLGTIRHGGRILWDDDLDLCMLREDYNQFRSVASQELPEECWFLDNLSSEEFDNPVSRVINSRVYVLEGEALEKYHGFPYVAGVDIFWLDNLPPTKAEEKELHRRVRFLYAFIDKIKCGEFTPGASGVQEMNYYLQKMESDWNVSFDRNRPIKPQLYALLEKMCSSYTTEEVRELTNIPVWAVDFEYRLSKECFSRQIKFPFENTEIMVPAGYYELLKNKYGDNWMKPVRSGGAHEYPTYKKQQEFLKKEKAAELYEYKFSEKELVEVESARMPKITLQKKVRELIPLLQEAHEEIQRCIADGNFDSVLQMLGECQEAAIQIGTMIEEEKGEGHTTVRLLEQYCEIIFQIHTGVSQGEFQRSEEEIEKVMAAFSEFEQKMSVSVECDLREKKDIVFLPYKESLWGAMESVWRAASEEEDTDVYVIPIPYYYKDAYGRAKTEDPHYETEGFPENVTVTSYEDYNFQMRHPDIIVIQCPYDEYNYGMTVHPFFYATNLKQYTDKLVYIPAFVMDEIGPGDERARETLKSYCNMPGVVHADTVIVQSRQMKDVYVELLTEFAGEDTRQIWEKKIVGPGSPAYDQKEVSKENTECPAEWLRIIEKPDGSRKKIILYNTSASALLFYGQKMIEKMREVFQVFRDNQDDIAVIWQPDGYVQDIGESMDSDLLQQYEELIQEYLEESWGIYEDSPEAERAVRLCDACYGDGGNVMNRCRNLGKVVMLQSVDR